MLVVKGINFFGNFMIRYGKEGIDPQPPLSGIPPEGLAPEQGATRDDILATLDHAIGAYVIMTDAIYPQIKKSESRLLKCTKKVLGAVGIEEPEESIVTLMRINSFKRRNPNLKERLDSSLTPVVLAALRREKKLYEDAGGEGWGYQALMIPAGELTEKQLYDAANATQRRLWQLQQQQSNKEPYSQDWVTASTPRPLTHQALGRQGDDPRFVLFPNHYNVPPGTTVWQEQWCNDLNGDISAANPELNFQSPSDLEGSMWLLSRKGSDIQNLPPNTPVFRRFEGVKPNGVVATDYHELDRLDDAAGATLVVINPATTSPRVCFVESRGALGVPTRAVLSLA